MERLPMVRRAGAAVVAAAMAVLLGGCLLWPGAFTATLDLRRGGAFSFTYDGEIHLMALSKLARLGQQADVTEFVADDCYDDDLEVRECTEGELAEQRRAWGESSAERAEEKEREAEAARAMLGGIDPADPAAAEELAAKLRRQAGWKRVDHKGDGLFDVSFSIVGRIDHDFQFPTMEGFPMVNSFVTVTRRSDGTVRIEALGFAPQAGGNPFQGLMAGMGGTNLPTGGNEATPPLPRIEGTFTIVTDGELLANNTDEGPATSPNGRSLAWKVNARTRAAPMALVRIH